MVAEAVAGAPDVEHLHTRAIDDVVRIRYIPDARDVEERDRDRDLGIVVGSLPAPTDVRIDGTTLHTPTMVVEVGLRPFSVSISTPDGVERCRIGGREKNMWGMWAERDP